MCWPFRHHGDLAAVARGYVEEGLARNERVVYASDRAEGELRRDLDGVPGLDEHLDRGRLQLLPFDSLQAPQQPPPVHPAAELPLLATMTTQARDAGYSGLRIFANGTRRVHDPARRAQHVGYEHLIDRFCLEHALTMLCAYDRTALGDAGVAELACVHPQAHGGLSPFQLSASPRGDLALAGSVDTFSAADLVTALHRIEVMTPGVQLSIDLTALEFVDHRALITLDQHAARHRTTLALRSAPSIVARLIELIPLRAARMEDTP